jgi:hypothetical protein
METLLKLGSWNPGATHRVPAIFGPDLPYGKVAMSGRER